MILMERETWHILAMHWHCWLGIGGPSTILKDFHGTLADPCKLKKSLESFQVTGHSPSEILITTCIKIITTTFALLFNQPLPSGLLQVMSGPQKYYWSKCFSQAACPSHHPINSLVGCYLETNAWFPPFRCRSAIAVSPLSLRKLCKNSVSGIRITLHTWKILLRRCRSSCHCTVTTIP